MTYHAVTLEVRICVNDAVRGGVVASSVHGIRAGLIEGGLSLRIESAMAPAFDKYSRSLG